jgi:hypothetical protein
VSLDLVLAGTALVLALALREVAAGWVVEQRTRLARVELRKAELEAEERARAEIAAKRRVGFET